MEPLRILANCWSNVDAGGKLQLVIQLFCLALILAIIVASLIFMITESKPQFLISFLLGIAGFIWGWRLSLGPILSSR